MAWKAHKFPGRNTHDISVNSLEMSALAEDELDQPVWLTQEGVAAGLFEEVDTAVHYPPSRPAQAQGGNVARRKTLHSRSESSPSCACAGR